MKRPNILIAVSHDLGRHLNCYGIDTVNSPRIDALAAEGVRFSNVFCTAPQCSPSRASIFTGRYPHCNGVMGLTHVHFGWDFNPGEEHLAGILRKNGYHTSLVGHQHERRWPSADDYCEIVPGHNRLEVADNAVEHLRKVATGDQPFFLQIGFFEPHRPFGYGDVPPDDTKGVTIPPWLVDEPSARVEFAEYQGAIKALDEAFGRILDELDAQGVADNTIVIFTSDHGMPFPRAKCSLYDPGLQVPLVVRWPGGGWSGGRMADAMLSNIDYVPTILHALDIPVPEPVQGRSFIGLLDGSDYEERSEIFGEMTYHDYFDPRRCIRTNTHKLIANFSSAPFFMDPSQTWRPNTLTKNPPEPAYAYHPNIELYDLVKDPLEFENLADKPEHAAIQRELMQRLMRWMQETSDPLCSAIPPSPMHTGTMKLLHEASE